MKIRTRKNSVFGHCSCSGHVPFIFVLKRTNKNSTQIIATLSLKSRRRKKIRVTPVAIGACGTDLKKFNKNKIIKQKKQKQRWKK